MKTVKNIGFELKKNFMLLFRNWTTLALLIIAPLILILLVGYAFSGEELHDVKLGYISDSPNTINDFLVNISGYAKAVEYVDVETCLSDMRTEQIHLCLKFSGNFAPSGSGIPNGDVDFYFDNTRKAISTAVVSQVKEFFGVQAEQISLISAQTVIINVQNLLSFISDRAHEIDSIKDTAHDIRNDLTERKAELIQVREDFLPKYELAKELQATLNNYARIMNDSKSAVDNETETMRQLLNDTELVLDELYSIIEIPEIYSALNGTTYNMSDICTMSLDSNISELYNLTELCSSSYTVSFPVYYPVLAGIQNITFAGLYEQLDTVSETTDSTYAQISRLNEDYDETMAEFDNIKQLLDDEIERSDYYLALIDDSISEMDSLYASLSQKMSALENINPGLASDIVKPITQVFEELVSGIKNEQIAFPMLLTSIVVFISLLFSNVVALLEIHNKAYIRNIIAPVNDLVYTAGLALTNLLVVGFQILVLLGVAQFGFRMNVTGNIASLAPVLVLLTLIFIFIGMSFAYFSKTTQSSILMTTFVALGFFLFSNAVTSLEAMPKLAAAVAQFNPVVIANSALKKILIYNLPVAFMIPETVMLLVYTAVALTALVVISKIKNRQRF